MATNTEDLSSVPTYRTLFLGACILIGGAFGWWLTNFITTVDATHKELRDRIAKLESRAFAADEASKYRDAKIDDHEERIRRLDRKP